MKPHITLLLEKFGKSSGFQPETLGFSLAGICFPLRCQNMPLGISRRGFYFILSETDKSASFVPPSAEMPRLSGQPAPSQLGAQVCPATPGPARSGRAPLLRSPFQPKPQALVSFLCLKSIFVDIVTAQTEGRPSLLETEACVPHNPSSYPTSLRLGCLRETHLSLVLMKLFKLWFSCCI